MTCKGCGWCCTGYALHCDKPVEFEVKSFDKVPEDMTYTVRGTRFMKRDQYGHCVALKDNLCTIYDTRPKSCRDFKMRNPGCFLSI